MLTDQEIKNMFNVKLGILPEELQIEQYKTYSFEELTAVLDRRIAIENDPTILDKIAKDYFNYINAPEEDRRTWNFNNLDIY
jgi:hypothetical protein